LHSDQLFKFEREVESLQREINRLIDEQRERDISKDRLKEDLERKLKLQENTIAKYKQRQKEMEKTVADKGSGARRLVESQQEIEKLSGQLYNLKKKIKDGKRG
jgi:hypothetical protein